MDASRVHRWCASVLRFRFPRIAECCCYRWPITRKQEPSLSSEKAQQAQFVVIGTKPRTAQNLCFLLRKILHGHAALGPAMRMCFTANCKVDTLRTLSWFQAVSENGAESDSFLIDR